MYSKPHGVYLSATNRITISEELKKMLQIDKESITLDELILKLDLSTVSEIKKKLSQTESKATMKHRFKYTNSPNKEIWLEGDFKVTHLGQETEVYFEIEDISDTMNLESKSWMMESTLKSIVDNTMLVSFFAVNLQGELILYNERFYQKVKSIFNYEIKKGDKLVDVLRARSVNDEYLKLILLSVTKYFDSTNKEKFQSVEKITINESSTLYYECEYSPIVVRENKVIGGIVFVRDVTMDVYMKEELIKEKQLEKNANEAKSKFLSNMGHEIRTPLNGVIGMTNLLLDSELTSKQLYMVNIVKESGEYLLNVINDILDFSKIEAGEITLVDEVVDICGLALKLKEMFSFKAEESQIKFNVEIEDNVPRHIKLDSFRLKQILINLIGNSFKFTEHGHIKVTIDVIDHKLMFTVEDTGIGIPQEKLEHIFDSFKQVSDDTTKKYGGSGLGLTISKELVELMDGKIKVSSRVGVGSVFYFSLPIRIPEEEELRIFEHVSDSEISILKDINVLVAEDNKINQILMAEILSKYQCSFDIVPNGIEVIEHIRLKKYDCILMDISMPEMDGVQTTKLIRKTFDKDELPIVAVTAHATKEYRDDLLSIGMNDFMTKPVDTRILIQMLNKYSNGISKMAPINALSSTGEFQTNVVDKSNLTADILKNVTQMNFNYIETQLMGNKALVPEIGKKIVNMMQEEIIPQLKSNVSNNRLEDCLKLTHKAKGSVSNFGEINMVQTIRKMEEHIRTKEIDGVIECILELQNETEKFQSEIMKYRIS